MKAYVVITGLIFAALTVLHGIRTAQTWNEAATHPGDFYWMAGLGLVALALTIWAVVLLGRPERPLPPSA